MRSSDIRDISLPKRRPRLFGFVTPGFAADDLDAFLDRCADALEAYERRRGPQGPDSREIVQKRFALARRGEVYDPDAVDDFLDEIVFALREYEKQSGVAERAASDDPFEDRTGLSR